MTSANLSGVPPEEPDPPARMDTARRILVHVWKDRAGPQRAPFLQVASADASSVLVLHEAALSPPECDGCLQQRGGPGGGAVFSGQEPLHHRWRGPRSTSPAEGQIIPCCHASSPANSPSEADLSAARGPPSVPSNTSPLQRWLRPRWRSSSAAWTLGWRSSSKHLMTECC